MKSITLILVIITISLSGIAQEGNPPDFGFCIGINAGAGVSTPVTEVYETGAQWGMPWSFSVGTRIKLFYEVSIEATLFYKNAEVYDPTEDFESTKTARNYYLLTASWYPGMSRTFYVKAGIGMASYTSYNKERPDQGPSDWPDQGNYGDNGVGTVLGVGYDLPVGKAYNNITFGLSYYFIGLPTLKYDNIRIDEDPVLNHSLIFSVGYAMKM